MNSIYIYEQIQVDKYEYKYKQIHVNEEINIQIKNNIYIYIYIDREVAQDPDVTKLRMQELAWVLLVLGRYLQNQGVTFVRSSPSGKTVSINKGYTGVDSETVQQALF